MRGFGLIGMTLNERTDLAADTESVAPLRSDAVSHTSILSCYVALLLEPLL